MLVVDDEPIIRALVLESFEPADEYKLYLAEDGQRALALAHEIRPHVVILDVSMPGISGIEVCRALKSNPETKQIRIVMLTAMGDDQDIASGYAAGADEYLLKPFRPKQLRSAVERVLAPPAGEAKAVPTAA